MAQISNHKNMDTQIKDSEVIAVSNSNSFQQQPEQNSSNVNSLEKDQLNKKKLTDLEERLINFTQLLIQLNDILTRENKMMFTASAKELEGVISLKERYFSEYNRVLPIIMQAFQSHGPLETGSISIQLKEASQLFNDALKANQLKLAMAQEAAQEVFTAIKKATQTSQGTLPSYSRVGYGQTRVQSVTSVAVNETY